MIYVLSSLHLKMQTLIRIETMQGSPGLQCHFTLVSSVVCSVVVRYAGNFGLPYSEMYLHGVFVVCACTFCLLLNKLYIHCC